MIKLGGAINQFLLPVLAKLVPLLTGAVQWFGALSPGVKKFLMVLAAAVVVGGPVLMFAGAMIKTAGAVLRAVTWIGRLGTASEVAAGETSTGGLAGLTRGLGRAALGLGAFYLAITGGASVLKDISKGKTGSAVKHGAMLGGGAGVLAGMAAGGEIGTALGIETGPGPLLTGALGAAVGGATGGLLSLAHKLGIPGLISGGTVLSAGLTLVGEAGPELLNLPRAATVSPNIGPSGFNASLQHMTFPGMSGGGGGNETTIVQVVLDGKVVAESVNNRNRKTQNRR
jgi:hypothetical protein